MANDMTMLDRLKGMFGFQIKREPEPDTQRSFTPDIKDDGAVTVAAGGALGTYVDLDGTVRTEAELVAKYREMALQPEIDQAINQVVNDAIVQEDGEKTVELIQDDLNVDPGLKEVIEAEFQNILQILDFDNSCYDIFRRWYIEGRQYYHVVIDEARPEEGIKELRYIDPRKIRKIREVVKIKDPATDAIIQKTKAEYFIYSEMGLNSGNKVMANFGTTGLRISLDSIIHVTSGVTDQNNLMGLSYLHGAIKPLNQLRSLEDSSIIYHLSRAPERRIFKVDVGNLPKLKAEQYINDLMVRYKNKLSYNAATGEIRDDRKFMTFLEDYWLPTREGGRGTEIDVLSGGTQLPDLLNSVQYFQDRLYRSLQVPTSRMNPDNMYTLGRATEVSRDEVNFAKFIRRIQNKFAQLFVHALEKQLILKQIATPDDWEIIKKYIRFRFHKDNYWDELKEAEVFMDRLARLQAAMPYAGVFFSWTQLRKEILMQTEEDIQRIDEEIYMDLHNPQYNQMLMMDEEQQSEAAAGQVQKENK